MSLEIQGHVLRLATRGWRLFPCEIQGKKPLLKDWPNLASDKTGDILYWLEQYPGCNWAVVTGLQSRIFVLDVDGDHGAESLRGLCERYGRECKDTLTVTTGRGKHLYFEYPEGEMIIRNSASKLAAGLDIRGEGGYAIVPPSVHSSGVGYTWVNSDESTSIASAPSWLLEMVTTANRKIVLITTEADDDTIPSGRRNATLTSRAGVMQRAGMAPQAIEAALLAENSARCRPALPEDEVREIARSISRYAPAPRPQNDQQETAALLDDVRHCIRRFVAISNTQSVALALFTVYSYAADSFECAPYLQITSAEKRCGKSRLLEVLELLVHKAWLTSRVSAAALYRKLDSDHPTLLLDESDATFGGDKDYAEALRGVLNAGHRKGGRTSLCTGKGSEIKVVDFDVFGPKVIAGIGKLPDTIADRTVPIQLQRKGPHEKVERFRPRLVAPTVRDLKERLANWPTLDRLKMLANDWPNLPELLSDRQQDVSEPLLAVADLAGRAWGDIARQSLIELFGGTVASDDSVGVHLLSDIRAAFGENDRLSSNDLVKALVSMEESPWSEFSYGREITTSKVAYLLRQFNISPRTIRVGEVTIKGYLRDWFQDVWLRYLTSGRASADLSRVTSSPSAETLDETPIPETSHKPIVTAQETAPKPMVARVVTRVTGQTSFQPLGFKKKPLAW